MAPSDLLHTLRGAHLLILTAGLLVSALGAVLFVIYKDQLVH